MKKTFMVLMLGLVSIICFGQNVGTTETIESVEYAENSESEIVELIRNEGTLKKIELIEIPSVKGISFEAIIVTDLIKNNKYGGVHITTIYTAPYIKKYYMGTIDNMEIDGCINALTMIKENILPTTPEVYTKIKYTTKDFVEIGAVFSPTNGGVLTPAPGTGKWFAYISTKSYLSNSKISFQAKHIDSLITAFRQAKQIIQEEISK